jgi:hypothetical protein
VVECEVYEMTITAMWANTKVERKERKGEERAYIQERERIYSAALALESVAWCIQE